MVATGGFTHENFKNSSGDRTEIITYRKPFTNVTSMEPVILVNSFGSFLRVVKVAFEDVGTFQTNLEEQNINDDIAV